MASLKNSPQKYWNFWQFLMKSATCHAWSQKIKCQHECFKEFCAEIGEPLGYTWKIKWKDLRKVKKKIYYCFPMGEMAPVKRKEKVHVKLDYFSQLKENFEARSFECHPAGVY